ncbi:glycosyltransferase [Neptuniibacter sp. PT8_73]|uniref:glycosyltransferase n=1 Tax=unclassified Neptuniibacter TaxID=2630693 RepID=UPI0039F71968
MANIVFAWELGAGLGHLSRLAVLMNRLDALGHNLTLVLNDPSNLDAFDLPESLLILPAPSFKTLPSKKQPTVSLPCILQNRGFQGPKVLRGIVRSWHGIFKVTQPDLLIFDYAPSAMLAARNLACPKVNIGSGFSELVPGSPCSVMRTDLKDAAKLTKLMESRIVGLINCICDQFGYHRVQFLSDLYQYDLAIISTLPDLDPYKRNPDKSLYINFEITEQGVNAINWKSGNKKRVFVYLTMGHYGVIETLDALLAENCEVICYGMGFPPKMIETYSRKGIQFSLDPINAPELLPTADLVVCHAGKGLITESLFFGTPLLLLPTHMEQRMNAELVKSLGSGLTIAGNINQQNVKKVLSRLLTDTSFTDNAGKIAKKYEDRDTLSSLDNILDRITSLLE